MTHTGSKEGPARRRAPTNRNSVLPQHTVNHNGHKVTKGIQPEGESGRSWIHPWHFLRISFRSSCPASSLCNVLWPVVPAAIAVRYAKADLHLIVFILTYIAMVPCANLVGFAGQEFARKLPRVVGILVETTLGSIVEVVLFMVLLTKDEFEVIRAAILGSILSTLLLCLGLCFYFGGMNREEQTFDEAVGEVGNGLLLTAGFGLIVPAALYTTLKGRVTEEVLNYDVLQTSRVTSVLLIIAYAVYVWFNMHTHHSLYDALFYQDELADNDRHQDLRKDKLTLSECILALVISIGLVSLIAIILVEEIPYIVKDHGISDLFMGLILVPLVEKFAEHITAIDEAWDNTMNLAMAHVLGATIQTALLNGPLTVIVAWGLHKEFDLNFELFTIIVVILSVLVVGNFLRDQKTNYLEGALCVIVYVIIAVAAFYFPNLHAAESGASEGGGH